MITTDLDIDTVDLIINSSGNIEGFNRFTLKQMILGNAFNDRKFLIVDVDKGELQAFTFATVETLDGEDVCFCQAHYSKKSGVTQIMLDKLISWSKGLGLKRIVFMTRRNPKAWERKYKFTRKYFLMEKEI